MKNVLVVDVGGTHVKILATGKKEKREVASGPSLTAPQMVSESESSLRTGSTKWCRLDTLDLSSTTGLLRNLAT